MMKRGKKYKAIVEKIDKSKDYSVEEALKIIVEGKIAKFDESVEVHMDLNVDAKKGDQQIRGSITLPHGTGKTKRVGVITSTKADEAKKAGADLVGDESLIEKIKKGEIEFDVLVATPEMMPKLAGVARVLGPKGLMPNPKTDTVTEKIAEIVEMLKKGKLDFKNDKTGGIHQSIGKVSFGEDKLKENFEAFIEAVSKAKPEAVKGQLIKKIVVCSTMGPGVKVVK
ncbi:MAG: 50S ribosomal protein L1 [Candidatus Moranbacteria bacterium]|nr:50S ribosomal protein L1 [Candidatus Moranbacteria bacterium]